MPRGCTQLQSFCIPRRIVRTTRHLPTPTLSAAAAQEESQFITSTAPGIRRDHYAQLPRRVPRGPGAGRHCRPRRNAVVCSDAPPSGVKVNCAKGAREGGLDRLVPLPPWAKELAPQGETPWGPLWVPSRRSFSHGPAGRRRGRPLQNRPVLCCSNGTGPPDPQKNGAYLCDTLRFCYKFKGSTAHS